MTLRDQGLEDVRASLARGRQHRPAAVDVGPVPERAVLFLEREQLAVGVEPRASAATVWISMSASSPRASDSSGMRSTTASASETADAATSVKATSLYPALKARYSTARTPFSRSSSNSAGGTRYGMPA